MARRTHSRPRALLPGPPPPDLAAICARVLYRDGLVLVLDKPAGLPVHPGPGGGLTLEHYLDGLRFGLRHRPHLAHRLDRDTSGCLVLGRHPKALRRLGRLFSSGRVEKLYWAIVRGRPQPSRGTVDAPLAKVARDPRSWWMRVDPAAGRPAITDYRVIASDGALSWVELRPRTGRTHQLRVHMAHLGHPILGDPVYGDEAGGEVRMMLHARAITLPLYPARPPLRIEAPVPEPMRTRLIQIAQTAGMVPEEIACTLAATVEGG